MPGGRGFRTLGSRSARGGSLGATVADAFEFPRRKTPHMQVVPVHGGFGVVALELKLKSRLVAAHGFTAHRAGRTHPRSAPHAVRPPRRQPPAADRVSGLFAKDGFVRNCRAPGSRTAVSAYPASEGRATGSRSRIAMWSRATLPIRTAR